MKETDGTLLVAIGNTEVAERLLDTAADIAADRSYSILLTYVVEVTPQIPLSEGETLLKKGDKEILEQAEILIKDAGVPAESRIRYARDTATGIVGGATEYDADLILMGWRGRPPRRNIVLGSYLDTVLRNAPCDVLVKRIRTPQTDDVGAILVPVTEGAHTHLTTAIAGSIARCHNASVTLFHVLPSDSTDAEYESANELLDRMENRIEDVTVHREVDESDHVAGRITDETAHHDITILGTSERSLLRQKLLGTISESVGRNASGTAMIAQRHASSVSQETTLTDEYSH